jgi:hypothetical protein
MSILSKKIAKLYMQKQAGTQGAIFAFPNLLGNLKDQSSQTLAVVSDALLEGILGSVYSPYTNVDLKYDILKQEEVEGEISISYWHPQHRRTEGTTGYGTVGADWIISVKVEMKELAKELATFLSKKVPKVFSYTSNLSASLYMDLVSDFKSDTLKNALSLLLKKKTRTLITEEDKQNIADYVGLLDFTYGDEQELSELHHGIQQLKIDQSGLTIILELESFFDVFRDESSDYDFSSYED